MKRGLYILWLSIRLNFRTWKRDCSWSDWWAVVWEAFTGTLFALLYWPTLALAFLLRVCWMPLIKLSVNLDTTDEEIAKVEEELAK